MRKSYDSEWIWKWMQLIGSFLCDYSWPKLLKYLLSFISYRKSKLSCRISDMILIQNIFTATSHIWASVMVNNFEQFYILIKCKIYHDATHWNNGPARLSCYPSFCSTISQLCGESTTFPLVGGVFSLKLDKKEERKAFVSHFPSTLICNLIILQHSVNKLLESIECLQFSTMVSGFNRELSMDGALFFDE